MGPLKALIGSPKGPDGTRHTSRWGSLRLLMGLHNGPDEALKAPIDPLRFIIGPPKSPNGPSKGPNGPSKDLDGAP
jgi:hypothetical protein